MKIKSILNQFLLGAFLLACGPATAAPFRMVVLGDSIMWGQGLLDADKIHIRVRDMLQSQLGYGPFSPESLAHSGAIIGNSDDANNSDQFPGEIPSKFPTVLRQCNQFTASPETVDMVLLNGGANDVNAPDGSLAGIDVVDPRVSITEITNRIEDACHHRMTNLLEKVSAKFTRATIVVSGYFPIVSEETIAAVPTDLVDLLTSWFGSPIGPIGDPQRDEMVAKSRLWAEESAAKLSLAVDEANAVNRALGRYVRIVFADPRFGPSNAMLASQHWLFTWRPDILPPFAFVPEDPMRPLRVGQCLAHLRPPTCEWASLGHPNPSGAQAYADAIFAAYLNGREVWVAFNPSCPACGDGTAGNPFGSLAAGRNGVPNGGTILIRSGSLAETITINKNCRLQAWGGAVTIGR